MSTSWWGIVALAIGVRLALLLLVHPWTTAWGSVYMPDTSSYLRPAQEWLQTGHFAVDGVPEIVRPPGYPAFLVPGLLLGHVALVTVLLQIAVSGATLLGVASLGGLLWRAPAASWVSALLYALDPLSVVLSLYLLSDTLCTTCLVWALVALLWWVRQGYARYILLAAGGFAAATYVRPIVSVVPFVLGPLLGLWAWRQRAERRQRLAQLGLGLIVCSGLLGAWQWRNAYVSGYHGFSAISPLGLYFCSAAGLLAHEQGRPLEDVTRDLGFVDRATYEALHPEQRTWPLAVRYRWMGQEAIRLLWQRPALAFRQHIVGSLKTLFAPGDFLLLHLFEHEPASAGRLRVVFLVLVLGYYGLAALSVWVGAGWRRVPVLVLLVTVATLAVVSGGPCGSPRYRLLFLPIICGLAAGVAGRAWSYGSCRQH